MYEDALTPLTPTRPPTRRFAAAHGLASLALSLFLVAWPYRPALAQVSQTTPPPSRSLIIQELHAGNPAHALSLVDAALRAAPHDCSLLSLQGVAFSGLGESQKALGSFRTALATCPDYLPALEGAAQIEFASNRDAADPLLRHILQLAPGDATAHAMLAASLRSAGSCSEALPHFQAGQSLFSSRPDLQQSYAACLVATGDPRAALTVFEDLLQSTPNDSVRYDVALLQWRTGTGDVALKTLAPLLSGVHPVPALALASKIHEERGETPEAVALLRQAIVQAPDQLDNYLDFAALAYRHNSFQVGVDILNSGLQRLGNSPPLLVARGVLEVQLSMSDAAIADFNLAHRLDPKLTFAADAVGILRSQQHQTGESLALFEQQARLHADDPLLQYLLAEQLAEQSEHNDPGRLDVAIAAARKAISLDSHYLAAHDLLALLYMRSDQPQLALAQTAAALALDPNDEAALYQEILARRRIGDTANLKGLSAKLVEARQQNSLRQQKVDHFALQEGSAP